MTSFTLDHDGEMKAPAEAVWAVLADYGRDPEWRAGVVAMAPTPLGPVAPGTTTHEELRTAGRTYRNDGVVLSVDPGRRFDWRTTAGVRAEGSRTVTPIDAARCRVELRLTVTPTGVDRLVAPLARRLLDRNLKADLVRLAALVETEVHDAGSGTGAVAARERAGS